MDTPTLIACMIGLAVVLVVEAIYLLFFARRSYRTQVNRRLHVANQHSKREDVLMQLRRERGLSQDGVYALPFVALNRLILQSGTTLGISKLLLLFFLMGLGSATIAFLYTDDVVKTAVTWLSCGVGLPLLFLRYRRKRRHAAFGQKFPDALDIIVRSLRAGHPVPTALTMVARELPDPVGTEFGLVGDELAYGADLETAMRNLYARVGQDDLPLFVTAVAIQNASGGNLGEILGNLSNVIRQRFKMRRKIRSLTSEGRISALILTAIPLSVFGIVQIASPDFYGDIWHLPATKIGLGAAAAWMTIGNLIMRNMVNFKI